MSIGVKKAIDNLFGGPSNEGLGGPAVKELDHDISWKTFVSLDKEASEEMKETVIEGIGSNSSLDLYNEYMTKEVIDGFVKTINSAFKAGKPINQFSNHDLRWENIISKVIWAKNVNGNLAYKGILNRSHPLYNQAKQMLEDGFHIENSVVIVRVKIQYEEDTKKGKDKDAIVSAKLKSIDFVGLGANEETHTNLKKSYDSKESGFYHVPKGAIYDPKNLVGDGKNMNLFGKKKEAGSSDNAPEETEKISEKAMTDAKAAIQAEIVSSIKEAKEKAMEEIKVEAKEAFNEAFDKEGETVIKSIIDAHLENRKQKALSTDAATEKALTDLKEKIEENESDADLKGETSALGITGEKKIAGKALAALDKKGLLR